MSHVCTIALEVKDLDSLAKACKRLGLELRLGQQTYRWFGESAGDAPLPAGFTAEDLGKCEHAIGIPGDAKAYEIGLVKRRDGKQGFALLCDFWDGGKGLEAVAGVECCKLKQAYATEVAIKQGRLQGFSVQEKQLADGSVRLTLSR